MLPLLRFSPILKRARWGGRRLETHLHKALGDESDYSESWELVDLGENQSRLIHTSGESVTLRELLQREPQALLGESWSDSGEFPLLLKYLDAQERLSLQVHPDDRLARLRRPGERGKTEAWYILDSTPDAVVYAGLKPNITREQLQSALRAGTVEEVLHRLPVKRGDCLLIPAGTVHAVGAGILLLEVQQASDITYRLHDWDWVDAQGNPRPLHLPEAFESIDFQRGPIPLIIPAFSEDSVQKKEGGLHCERLARCEYFEMQRMSFARIHHSFTNSRMRIWSVTGGEGTVRAAGELLQIGTGDSLVIPAATQEFEIQAEGVLEVIETRLGSES